MLFSRKAMHRSIPECRQLSRIGALARCFLFTVAGAVSLGAHAAEWKAGFAQIDISTRMKLPMGGYGTFFLQTPRTNGNGIHDPLYAGAMVIESHTGDLAALVSVDAVGLSGAQVSRIEARLRDSVDRKIHLMIAATHTHQSPDTLGLWGTLPRSGRNPRYSEQLETAVVQAVREAYALRVPAKITRRDGRHANDSSAASSADDVHDGFVSLFLNAQSDGRLLGTVTRWAAHPTVLGMENNALSADFVGAFRATLARAAEVPHLYFNGAIGKVYPLVPAADDADLIDDLFPNGNRDPDVKDSYRRVSTVGYRLANAVLKAPERTVSFSADSELKACHVAVDFPVDNALFKAASSLRVVETRIRSGHIRSRISSLSFAGLSFVTLPGEVFPKLLNKHARASWSASGEPIWLGMGQDWLGYFVEEGDYQNAKLKYWTDLSVHRQAARILLDGIGKATQGKDCVEWTDVE